MNVHIIQARELPKINVDVEKTKAMLTKLEMLFAKILTEKQCIPSLVDVVEISLSAVSADEIRDINRTYRDIDAPTDILSFPLWENQYGDFTPPDDWKVLPLGDLIISISEINKNAEINYKTKEEELVLIISHGLLHLIGRDHDTEEKEASMWQEQNEIVNRYFAEK
ncbi:MAG: rRNA maturation RNase YbeY [Synergistaceae bacterium]